MPTYTKTIFILWSFIIPHIIVNNSCSLIDTTTIHIMPLLIMPLVIMPLVIMPLLIMPLIIMILVKSL
jgi:hypothetical protein